MDSCEQLESHAHRDSSDSRARRFMGRNILIIHTLRCKSDLRRLSVCENVPDYVCIEEDEGSEQYRYAEMVCTPLSVGRTPMSSFSTLRCLKAPGSGLWICVAPQNSLATTNT